MLIMRRLAFAFLLLVFQACQKDLGGYVADEKADITFNLVSTPTKTLVETATEGDYISIRDACDPAVGKNAVGFWTEIITNEATGEEEIIHYDAFTEDGVPARLVYSSGEGKWVYAGNPQYWITPARYNFLAFYPQSLQRQVMSGASSVVPCTFVMDYNTHLHQEDLMMAYNEVLSNDPKFVSNTDRKGASIYSKHGVDVSDVTLSDGVFGFSENFRLSDNIPLHFNHMLAAVQVRFKFSYPDKDELIKCWFENSEEGGIHTVGMLVFGMGSQDRPKTYPNTLTAPEEGLTNELKQKLNEKRWENNQKNKYAWSTYNTDIVGAPIYLWQVQGTTVGGYSGIEFTDKKAAIAYSANKDYYEISGDVWTKVYSSDALSLVPSEQTFSSNKGWVLIIPQESSGKLKLCYSLSSAPENSTEIMIPVYTGTDENGNRDGDVVNGVTVAKEDCNHYLAGHRYIYTVEISETNVYTSVVVENWTELQSSTEIFF